MASVHNARAKRGRSKRAVLIMVLSQKTQECPCSSTLTAKVGLYASKGIHTPRAEFSFADLRILIQKPAMHSHLSEEQCTQGFSQFGWDTKLRAHVLYIHSTAHADKLRLRSQSSCSLQQLSHSGNVQLQTKFLHPSL